jgi:hypothetical protein
VDARLHHLQGKAKHVNATELLALLREFYRDKLTIAQRHVAVAKHVPHYDFNNTYQYVIAREDVQLNWLRDAITDMGGALEDIPEPAIHTSGKADDVQSQLIGEDREAAQQFVGKWRPRGSTPFRGRASASPARKSKARETRRAPRHPA